MGRKTDIGWARSTRNFWTGCTKISTAQSGGGGCDGCYAEAASRFFAGKSRETGQAKNWGPGADRRPGLVGAAAELHRWNHICAIEREHGVVNDLDRGYWDKPGFWPVFINNFSDVLDNEVPDEWRAFMWPVLEQCTNLDIYLVTKRIGNARTMFPSAWLEHGFPSHIRLLITVVNQMEADRDIPKLLRLPCKNGLSIEPQLGNVDLCETLGMWWNSTMECFEAIGPRFNPHGLGWVINGGESDQAGHRARPFVIGWARSLMHQCAAARVPFFMKQFGSNATNREGVAHPFDDRAGAHPSEWPEDLRVQEWPRAT